MKYRKTKFLTENAKITDAYLNICRKINESEDENNQIDNSVSGRVDNMVKSAVSTFAGPEKIVSDINDDVESWRERHRNRPSRGQINLWTPADKAARKAERYARREEKRRRRMAEEAARMEMERGKIKSPSQNNTKSNDSVGNIDVMDQQPDEVNHTEQNSNSGIGESFEEDNDMNWGIQDGNGDWFLNGTAQEITGKEFGPDSESAFRFTHDGAYKNLERWGDSMEDYEVRELPPTNSEIYKEYREFVRGLEPCVETKDGPIYIEYDPNRNVLKYGTVTNTGLLEDGSVEYDKNMTMLWNMQNVKHEILDKFGEYEEEPDEN